MCTTWFVRQQGGGFEEPCSNNARSQTNGPLYFFLRVHPLAFGGPHHMALHALQERLHSVYTVLEYAVCGVLCAEPQTQALVSSGRGKGLSRRSKGLFFHKFLLALLALAPLVLVLAEGPPAAILAPAPDALVREGC